MVRDDSGILHVASEARHYSSNHHQLNNGANRTVSKWTVQRLLYRMDFGSRLPTRVPLLNDRHQTASLAWAREHIAWSVED
ncbi:hypothetical protein TNCV_1833311 [Trichonephila clavipes]|nr:hypothetical protein TNCV_1833311 [Trichonephila clavipes]